MDAKPHTQDMTTTQAIIPATVRLDMTPMAADVLVDDHGWNTLEMESSYMAATGERWIVAVGYDEDIEAGCSPEDVLEAARYCVNTLKGWDDEKIEMAGPNTLDHRDRS